VVNGGITLVCFTLSPVGPQTHPVIISQYQNEKETKNLFNTYKNKIRIIIINFKKLNYKYIS